MNEAFLCLAVAFLTVAWIYYAREFRRLSGAFDVLLIEFRTTQSQLGGQSNRISGLANDLGKLANQSHEQFANATERLDHHSTWIEGSQKRHEDNQARHKQLCDAIEQVTPVLKAAHELDGRLKTAEELLQGIHEWNVATEQRINELSAFGDLVRAHEGKVARFEGWVTAFKQAFADQKEWLKKLQQQIDAPLDIGDAFAEMLRKAANEIAPTSPVDANS